MVNIQKSRATLKSGAAIKDVKLRLSDIRKITKACNKKDGNSAPSGFQAVESATKLRINNPMSFVLNGYRWNVFIDDPEIAALPQGEQQQIATAELYNFFNRKKYSSHGC